MSKIIAVDFDDTIYYSDHLEIGRPKWRVVDALRAEKRKGAKIILWTCRTGDLLEDAIRACQKLGLVFDAVNDNLPEIKESFGCNPRKIVASEYWDDKAVRVK